VFSLALVGRARFRGLQHVFVPRRSSQNLFQRQFWKNPKTLVCPGRFLEAFGLHANCRMMPAFVDFPRKSPVEEVHARRLESISERSGAGALTRLLAPSTKSKTGITFFGGTLVGRIHLN
jgi:hypothetical protein